MVWVISAYSMVIALVGLVGLWIARVRRDPIPARAVATIVTMMGVLGTFLGVVWSLRGFSVADSEQIQQSVQGLLMGMKGAFWTSVAGIATAILVRLAAPLVVPVDSSKRTLDDLVEAVREEGGATRSRLEAMDLSLRALPEAADALSSAIASQHDTANQAAVDSSATLVKLSETLGTVDASLSSVTRLVDNLLASQVTLHSHIGAMTTLNTDAEQAAPLLEQRLIRLVDGVTTTLTDSVDQSTQASSEAIEKSKAALVGLSDAIAEQRQALHTQTEENLDAGIRLLNRALESISGHHEESQKTFVQMSAQVAEQHAGLLAQSDESLQSISKLVQDAVTSLSLQQAETRQLMDESAEHFRQLDAQIGDELSKCLTHLGTHLTALSEKFVADYGKLTTNLRTVVELGEAVRRDEARNT